MELCGDGYITVLISQRFTGMYAKESKFYHMQIMPWKYMAKI